MTREDLRRCEAELVPLVPVAGASDLARELALSFNRSVDDVRAALLEPARILLERGGPAGDLPECLQRTVAELSFWRRVLVGVNAGAYRPDAWPADCLVRYLLS
jgi:hypothetical protein